MARLERGIQGVAHPGVAFEYLAHCAARGIDAMASPIDRRWRNAKCDVLVAWSHIHHGGRVLVTQDGHFPRRGEKLAQLGAGRVASPAEALEVLRALNG